MSNCVNCKYNGDRCQNEEVEERVNVYEESHLEIDGIIYAPDDCPKFKQG